MKLAHGVTKQQEKFGVYHIYCSVDITARIMLSQIIYIYIYILYTNILVINVIQCSTGSDHIIVNTAKIYTQPKQNPWVNIAD